MNWSFWHKPTHTLPSVTNPLLAPLRKLHDTLAARASYHETNCHAALAANRQEDFRLHSALLDNDRAVMTTLVDILGKQ